MGTLPTITPDDTHGVFIGSRALLYPWWGRVEFHGIDGYRAADDWSVTVHEYDPDEGKHTGRTATFDHVTIMRAVRRIVTGGVAEMDGNSRTRRECRALLFRGADECDFDADLADRVLQVIAFGEVVYG